MNKVCVVTGGAAGIGRCIVEMFAESGYTVYFIDKTPEAVELAEVQETALKTWNSQWNRTVIITKIQTVLSRWKKM